MRIAFLADASLPHTQRWVNHFVARGHECLLVTLEEGGEYDCPTVRLRASSRLPRFLRYTSRVREAANQIRDLRPNVVNAHFLPNYGWMAARIGTHPLVLTTLGSDILVAAHRTSLHRWRTRYVLARCDRVTSDADNLTRAIAAFGFSPDRILTVPFGIEAGRFDSVAERPQAPIVVLSTRRLEPIYDVETLLRAVSLMRRDIRDGIDLRVAGSGSCEMRLRRHAVTPRPHFLGWLDRRALDRELAAAHVYVSTARSDSTSVSLLEAMAAGCLPVVTDIEGNREWVRDGHNGLLFACADAEALAVQLERAATDSELRTRAAEANRRIVAERGSWNENMGRVEALFAELAGT